MFLLGPEDRHVRAQGGDLDARHLVALDVGTSVLLHEVEGGGVDAGVVPRDRRDRGVVPAPTKS